MISSTGSRPLTTAASTVTCSSARIAAAHTQTGPISPALRVPSTSTSYWSGVAPARRPLRAPLLPETLPAAPVTPPTCTFNDNDEAIADKGLEVGLVVRIHGLQASPELNDIDGTLLGFDESRSRWQVELASGGGVQLIKPINLQPAPPRCFPAAEEWEEEEDDAHGGVTPDALEEIYDAMIAMSAGGTPWLLVCNIGKVIGGLDEESCLDPPMMWVSAGLVELNGDMSRARLSTAAPSAGGTAWP